MRFSESIPLTREDSTTTDRTLTYYHQPCSFSVDVRVLARVRSRVRQLHSAEHEIVASDCDVFLSERRLDISVDEDWLIATPYVGKSPNNRRRVRTTSDICRLSNGGSCVMRLHCQQAVDRHNDCTRINKRRQMIPFRTQSHIRIANRPIPNRYLNVRPFHQLHDLLCPVHIKRTGPRNVRGPADQSDGFEHVQKLWSVRDLSVVCEPRTDWSAVRRGGANIKRRS
jgi:hypothetical protein